MIIISESTKTKSLWDDGVQSFPQSFAWGESRELVRQKISRLVCTEDGREVFSFLVILKKIPLTSWSHAFIPRSSLPDETLLTSIARALVEYGKKNHIAFFTWEPDVFTGERLLPPSFTQSTYRHFAQWSPFIDLAQSFEVLESNFSKTVRNETRLAIKNGGRVVDGTDEKLFADFLALATSTRTRQDFTGYTKEYYRAVFETLSTYGQARVFVGYDDERPVCAALVFLFKDVMTYAYAGSLGRETPRGMMYLLVVSIMKYGQAHNFLKLDLFGSLDPNFTGKHPWNGFTQFKKAFGPDFKQYVGTYDLVVNRPIYTMFTFIQSLKKKFKK